ncbi:VirB8/TrbF family protein [Azohydromonas caseinilytica]|uniref:Conjugal transfer protein TrbF n=1 Tax=Azohydromonas caseinilytica TaxID=2728836 RepID=A0A848FFA6_9BURK|nr:VirB8/TrbF family protein [Azohydromonas caseinilytica]NML17009.1 conjugal transfer protein TrbF [Azohydromonas caseinilytica]
MSSFKDAVVRARVTASRIKYLFINRPDTDTENPYLNARRTWNLHVGAAIYSRFVWQIMGLLGMLIGLGAVGGMYDLAKSSKYLPYLYAVNRANEVQALGPAHLVSVTDPGVQMAEMKRFVEDWRLVTPDVAVQNKAIERVYSKLIADAAATAKFSGWFQENTPAKRAEKVVVNTQSMTGVWQSKDTVQLDWEETTHDRSGAPVGKPVLWRAMLTVRHIEPTADTSAKEMDLNPARVFVTDGSWTQIATK